MVQNSKTSNRCRTPASHPRTDKTDLIEQTLKTHPDYLKTMPIVMNVIISQFYTP